MISLISRVDRSARIVYVTLFDHRYVWLYHTHWILIDVVTPVKFNTD